MKKGSSKFSKCKSKLIIIKFNELMKNKSYTKNICKKIISKEFKCSVSTIENILFKKPSNREPTLKMFTQTVREGKEMQNSKEDIHNSLVKGDYIYIKNKLYKILGKYPNFINIDIGKSYQKSISIFDYINLEVKKCLLQDLKEII